MVTTRTLLALGLLACTPEPSPAPEEGPVGRIEGAPILDAPVILGGIDNAAVEGALDLAAIRACGQPGEAGKVLVRFRLQREGKVVSVETRATTLRDPEAEACIHQRLKETVFPPLTRGDSAIVTWTFAL